MERASGFAKLIVVPTREAKVVTQAIIKALRPHREQVLTITFDNGNGNGNGNGKEFAGHLKIAKKLKADCYFADPYSSWQRGCNENSNGLVRPYFPKRKTSFIQVSQKAIDEVEHKLNSLPRKLLGWQSPTAAFKSGKPLKKLTIDCRT